MPCKPVKNFGFCLAKDNTSVQFSVLSFNSMCLCLRRHSRMGQDSQEQTGLCLGNSWSSILSNCAQLVAAVGPHSSMAQGRGYSGCLLGLNGRLNRTSATRCLLCRTWARSLIGRLATLEPLMRPGGCCALYNTKRQMHHMYHVSANWVSLSVRPFCALFFVAAWPAFRSTHHTYCGHYIVVLLCSVPGQWGWKRLK